MSNAALEWAWDLRGMHAPAKLVLVCLCDHADEDGLAFPSLTTVADECGLNRATVARAINYLSDMQLITKQQKQRPRGGFTSTHYHVKVGQPFVSEQGSRRERLVAESSRVVAESDGGSRREQHGWSQGATRVVAESDSNPQLIINESPTESSLNPARKPRRSKSEVVQTWGPYPDKEAYLVALLKTPDIIGCLTEKRVRDEVDRCLAYRTTQSHGRLDLTCSNWVRDEARKEARWQPANGGSRNGQHQQPPSGQRKQSNADSVDAFRAARSAATGARA